MTSGPIKHCLLKIGPNFYGPLKSKNFLGCVINIWSNGSDSLEEPYAARTSLPNSIWNPSYLDLPSNGVSRRQIRYALSPLFRCSFNHLLPLFLLPRVGLSVPNSSDRVIL